MDALEIVIHVNGTNADLHRGNCMKKSIRIMVGSNMSRIRKSLEYNVDNTVSFRKVSHNVKLVIINGLWFPIGRDHRNVIRNI